MFTTGSKFLIGATTLALAGTLIFGSQGGNLGTIGLVSATIALAFLTAINFWVRDSNVSSMDTPGIATSGAAQPAAPGSMWPMIGGLGVAVVALGLVVGRAITWLGLIIVLAATFEWMVQAWSERASSDPRYNASVRQRLLHPVEFPVVAAVGLGVVIFSFSRIVLYLPAAGGAIIFGGIALVVLLFGSLLATRRSVGRSLVTALCTVGSFGLIGAGVASAVAGSREIEKHPTASYADGTCGEAESEADERASQSIASKSNLIATVILEDGKLRAEVIGVIGSQETLTLARSNPVGIRFKNLDAEPHRMLIDLGYEVQNAGTATESKVPLQICTQAARSEGSQYITVSPPRPSAASDVPYTLSVPGVDGASIEVVVP